VPDLLLHHRSGSDRGCGLRWNRIRSQNAAAAVRVELDELVRVNVDDPALLEIGLARFVAVVEMDVAVEMVSRVKPAKESTQRFETAVRGIVPIVHATRWRVRDQDVERSSIPQTVPEEAWCHLEELPGDLSLRVLLLLTIAVAR
jgi:hypothetical protein